MARSVTTTRPDVTFVQRARPYSTKGAGDRALPPPEFLRPEPSLLGSGAFVPRGEIFRLLFRELVDLDAHRVELEPGDLLVDPCRHRVDLALELAGVLHGVLE